MSTYLELCQTLVREGAISGTLSTTVGATGEHLRVTNWIISAWKDIQTMRDDWGFMRSSYFNGGGASFTTVASTSRYTLGSGSGTVGVTAANFTRWDRDSFRYYNTTSGVSSEVPMTWIDYDVWRDAYMLGAQQSVNTVPVVVAIAPDMTVCVPPTLAGYTIRADYWRAPQVFSANADEPTGLPSRFHDLIWWKALKDHGYYKAAPEVLQRAREGYRDLMGVLQEQYRPEVYMEGALA